LRADGLVNGRVDDEAMHEIGDEQVVPDERVATCFDRGAHM